ncbi:MAG TPA: response regulator [Chitinophagaceae bacterium]|nr:response regulator [Chitinophagaceae bacterium]
MKKNTILLVEDDELDVISFERTLKRLNIHYDLFIAQNGKEALSMLKDKENPVLPDVVLLDLNMPKMNGIEFLRALRREKKFHDLKVFIVTTSSETADRATTEELGISGYIIKPLSYTDNTRRADSMDSFVQFHLTKILNEKGY